jgi:hypothetical protein
VSGDMVVMKWNYMVVGHGNRVVGFNCRVVDHRGMATGGAMNQYYKWYW